MRHRFILTLGFLIALLTVKAQTTKAPVPEILNEVSYYNKSANELHSLQKDKARYVSKIKGMGYGGVSTSFVVDGDKSTIRLIQADRMSFIVALADGAGDPTGWFNLYMATVKKGKRSAIFSDMKVFGGKVTNKELVSFTVKKIGDQVYEIIPETKLEKGEYFFVNKGTLSKYGNSAADAFTFSVD